MEHLYFVAPKAKENEKQVETMLKLLCRELVEENHVHEKDVINAQLIRFMNNKKEKCDLMLTREMNCNTSKYQYRLTLHIKETALTYYLMDKDAMKFLLNID